VPSTGDLFYLPWGTYYSGSAVDKNIVWWSANDGDGAGDGENGRPTGYKLTDKSATLRGGANNVYYWLRSPHSGGSVDALRVYDYGFVDCDDVNYALGVRPAFKLNPGSVIFISEIVSSVSESGQTPEDYTNPSTPYNYAAATSPAKNYKLTVVSTDLTAGTLTAGGQAADPLSPGNPPAASTDVAPGYSVSVAATSASSGTNLTYKIVDSNAVVGYGQGSDNASLAVVAKDLSATDLAVGYYTVYVWTQKNNDINSHEGSTPLYFKLNVTSTPNPEAPNGVTAVAGNGEATVNFTPPTTSNGSPATTSYTVTCVEDPTKSATGATGPITVTGLTNGTTYTFIVTATNSVGDSAPSAASNSVTPTAPGGGGGG
jgi:hypothetical protein